MTVLTYHKIADEVNFERQIQYLCKHYKPVLVNQNLSDSKANLLITVDDGDTSFYYKAFPVLKKYNISAILFVVTNLVNTQKPFWWDELQYYLGKEEGNKKVWEVKGWTNKKRESYLKNLREKSSKPILKYEQLTTAQLREMQDAGIIIANHSHTHPMFDQCTPEELEVELSNSTKILKDFGFSPEIFAYPNGNSSVQSEAMLKKYGINKAYLFDHKINKTPPHPHRISRLIVNDNTPMWKFKLILSGWHTRILPFTRFAGKLTGRLKK
ncbi:polysaccharide deacetylase family protein [uncultured Salegentibacter sp.]|uniref:polysaccharide deacetylase family protein n=1 Tax=uncultured Salegentibacter sp. TaxID=259320 RepID=UPI00259566FC|nr:polysaccharide deacetylase family protein [uncultured Salegentibacter sp.]